MPTTVHMTIDEKRKYLKLQQPRYRKASRQERSHLLDDMVAITGLNRKYIIHLLHGDLERKSRSRERGPTYGPEVDAALLLVAESLDYICGERLQPVLLSTALDLERHGELCLSPQVKKALAEISSSTIDRRLSPYRDQRPPRLPRKSPTRPSHILRAVPMQRIPWDQPEPGHLEIDLVHHAGPRTSGDYLYTLQMIDVTTGWSERYAILGRSGMVVQDALRVLCHRLPFPILEVHTDNGSEFLNAHMLRFWSTIDPHIQLSRNRPWRKNDSRFVEQKNFTLVRAYLGYRRFDTVAQAWAINFLYERAGLYYNLFLPVMRLKEKVWVHPQGQPPHIKRRYDEARTPFQRLCDTGVLSEEQIAAISQLRRALNPRRLRQEILELIQLILALPNAAPGDVQDVFLTLSRFRPYIQKGEWLPRLDYHLTEP